MTDDIQSFNKAVQQERFQQIAKGYDYAHDKKKGLDHLLELAIKYNFQGDAVKTAAMISAARDLHRRSLICTAFYEQQGCTRKDMPHTHHWGGKWNWAHLDTGAFAWPRDTDAR